MSLISQNEGILLIYLLHKNEANINQIVEETELGQFALYSAINKLQNRGLLDEKKGPNRSRVLFLTRKGQEVAELVKDLQEKLER